MPQFSGQSDLASMLAELGVIVTAGGISSYGILDTADHVEKPDASGYSTVIIRAISLTLQTSLFSADSIAIDAILTADGAAYTVIERLAEGDGALTKLLLRAN